MPGLSAEDRLELHDLYSRYAYAYDAGKAEQWAALFTPAGTFGRFGEEPVRGSEALARFVVDNLGANPGVTHHTTNVLVEADGDGARGSAYVLVIRIAEGEVRLRNVGVYEDRFERTADGWRFASRTFTSKLPGEHIDALLVAAAA